MKRIYHPYWLWEDYKAGFYNNTPNTKKQEMTNNVIFMFSNENITYNYMKQVTNDWIYSCEHNLSNLSMNRIAYLGQGACCLYKGISCYSTMSAWNLLDINKRKIADEIALNVLKEWERKIKLENILKIGNKKGIQMEFQMKYQ